MATEVRPFGDLFEESPRNGLTRPKATRGIGVKMVNMGELFSCPRIRDLDMDRVPLSESEAKRFLLSEGDLLFARQSLVLEGAGKCSIFLGDDEPVTFESHVTRVRLNPDLADPHYYFYYLQSPHGRAAIRSIVEQGAGASGIRGSDLLTLSVQWLPVSEQRAIANILRTFDDKIELNRRTNRALEKCARVLYKSWFVDFDPVTANATCDELRLQGSLQNLFPSKLFDTERGSIPETWEPGILADFADLNPESWSKATRPSQINYVDLTNTKWGTIESVTKYRQEEAPSRAQRLLRPGDTIVGTVRPGNGSYALISEDGLTGSTGFAVLRPTAEHLIEFVYLAATAPENIESLAHLADGGAYPAVRPEIVAATPIVRAPGDVLANFSRIVKPFLTKMELSKNESRILSSLRDTLLPKLISAGQSVTEAEKLAERTT